MIDPRAMPWGIIAALMCVLTSLVTMIMVTSSSVEMRCYENVNAAPTTVRIYLTPDVGGILKLNLMSGACIPAGLTPTKENIWQ
jgi:hypothetical protein